MNFEDFMRCFHSVQPNCPGPCQTWLSKLGPRTGIMITIYPLFCQGVKNTADIFVNEKNAESFYLLGLLTFFQDFKMRQNADPVMTASPVCRDGSRTRNLEEWGVVSVINTM